MLNLYNIYVIINIYSPCPQAPCFQVDEDRSDDFAEGSSVDRFKFVFPAVLLVVGVHKTPG